jgi:hypothetical protein
MKLLSFRICVLGSIALVLQPFSRPAAAQSYCPGCKTAIVGAAVGVGAGVGVGIYLIHRSHTSLTGCVQQTDNGLSLTAKDGNTYELVNAPSEVRLVHVCRCAATKSQQLPGVPFGWTTFPETTAHAVPESQPELRLWFPDRGTLKRGQSLNDLVARVNSCALPKTIYETAFIMIR